MMDALSFDIMAALGVVTWLAAMSDISDFYSLAMVTLYLVCYVLCRINTK